MSKTKLDTFKNWLYDIFGTKSIGMNADGVIIRNFNGLISFSRSSRAYQMYKELFEYAFMKDYPKMKDFKNRTEPINKIELCRKALSAILQFFSLGTKNNNLIASDLDGEELKSWTRKLCKCCISVLEVFFDEEEAKLSRKLKTQNKVIVMQILELETLPLTKSSESNVEATRSLHNGKESSNITENPLSNMDEVSFLDLSTSQLAKLSRKIRTASPLHEPEDFLRTHISLPHREHITNDDPQAYTYEDLNENVDYANKVLNEMPDELDTNLRFRLCRYIGELRDYIKYFNGNLSLEKMQYTIGILETTKERFFKGADTPLPPKESFDSEEEWRTRFDYARAHSALEMCIRVLKRLIDYETKSKKD